MGGNGSFFNVEDPIYGSLPEDTSTDDLSLIEDATIDYGFFFNDYIDVTDRLDLLIGGRYDVADTDRGGPVEAVSEFFPQIAANYRMAQGVAVFVSYAEAFEPNTAFLVDDSGIPAETELFARPSSSPSPGRSWQTDGPQKVGPWRKLEKPLAPAMFPQPESD